jgi:hypothetical protein
MNRFRQTIEQFKPTEFLYGIFVHVNNVYSSENLTIKFDDQVNLPGLVRSDKNRISYIIQRLV